MRTHRRREPSTHKKDKNKKVEKPHRAFLRRKQDSDTHYGIL